MHPRLIVAVNNGEFDEETIPGAWVGDILIFLEDEQGPYCSNLSVKSTREEFSRPAIDVTPKTRSEKAERREQVRQLVEKELYKEADICTHHVAADELNPVVVANLTQLLLWQKRTCSLPESARDDIVGLLGTGMTAGQSALEILSTWAKANHQSIYEAKIVLHQAIWKRQLRIDLFQYFFIDHPLIPESRDVLELYGSWFRRSQS